MSVAKISTDDFITAVGIANDLAGIDPISLLTAATDGGNSSVSRQPK